ncbi:MAG: hypothetical protein GY788_22980 [bacterium]|nr:hypothetical protein [bacterium]
MVISPLASGAIWTVGRLSLLTLPCGSKLTESETSPTTVYVASRLVLLQFIEA